VLVGLVALLASAPVALARDDVIFAIDGTQIATSFFPATGLKTGQSVPTVIVGHAWGQTRDKDPNSSSNPALGTIGLGVLRRAGFNVLTWDARGFGESGGQAELDSPDAEALDVRTLVDYVGQQPEAQRDSVGDPRIGMVGASYGGTVQLAAAAGDRRIDAIVPDIAWHSLVSALFKDGAVKFGWGNPLLVTGSPTSLTGALPGGQPGNFDPAARAGFQDAAANGYLSEDARSFFDARGPGDLVKQVRTPTLFTQGTSDTFATLREAIENYVTLRANRVATKMIWFCGGHGPCNGEPGPGGFVVQRAVLAWFERYLRRDHTIDTGPKFEWIADDGSWHTATDYPLTSAGALTGRGFGDMTLAQDVSPSPDSPPAPQAGALNIPITPPTSDSTVLGEPTLDLTYFGTANMGQAFVYAQIVDKARNVVVGNQVTPLNLTLDGQPHTLSTKRLEAIALNAPRGARYTLQLVPVSSLYGRQYGSGSITFVDITARLPVVDPSVPAPGYPPNVVKPKLKLAKPARPDPPSGRVLRIGATATPRLSNVVLVMRDYRNRVVGTSNPAAFKGKRNVPIMLRRQIYEGHFVVTASGRAQDGRVARATLKLSLYYP
jgi:ABC-2 type transport system ATP-binding protein